MYTISYVGMDGADHTEECDGDKRKLAAHITFLEERGAQGISAEREDGTAVYQYGGFLTPHS